jgi:crotonobetainyl-CoA:carnitine CoA-transferase CaiB-like acyl-CoA transferase
MLAAPFAAHVLGQLGAEVIKVEPPVGDPTRKMVRGGPSGTLIAYSRGKKSICVDLKITEGQAVLQKLVATTDIIVHNLAPQSARRLNVTYEACRRSNPQVVYCHIQGYGSGPRADELASNPLIEAATGVMHDHRVDGRPSRLGPSYHDQFAGLYAVIGILAALEAKADERRLVEVGLYETGLHVAARDLAGFQLKEQLGVKPSGDGGGEFAMPGYGAYETADGRWIYLVMLSDAHWSKFCEALALPQGNDESLATIRGRKKQRPQIEAIVRNAIHALTYEQAAARLQTVGFGFTEVKAGVDVLNEPQAQQAGKLAAVSFGGLDFSLPNVPLPHQLAIDATEPPPLLGEHTMEIMRAIGYGESECAALKASGAVVVAEGGAKWAPPRETRPS